MSGCTPEKPAANVLARNSITERTTGSGKRISDSGGVASQEIDLKLV